MTLTKIKPLVYILGGITIIILLVLFGSVFLSQKDESIPPLASPSPVSQNKSIQLSQAKNFEDELAKISHLLPLNGPNYTVEYNKSLNLILAKINPVSNGDYSTTKKQIEQVILANNVEDICVLNIFWINQNPQIDLSSNDNNISTSNCPVVPPKK